MAYLTRKQAMEYLQISNTKLWRLTSERRITFYQEKPGAKMLFRETDLDRYAESLRVSAPKISPYATLRKQRSTA